MGESVWKILPCVVAGWTIMTDADRLKNTIARMMCKAVLLVVSAFLKRNRVLFAS